MPADKAKPKFSDYLFWDVDKSKLDYDESPKYVIERVTQLGKLQDWQELKRYYGLEKIKDTVIESYYLDKVTLGFLSFYFDIPKENFKCYAQKQSMSALWPY